MLVVSMQVVRFATLPGPHGSSSMHRWRIVLRLRSRRPRESSWCMKSKVAELGLHSHPNYLGARVARMPVQPMDGCMMRRLVGCNRRSIVRGPRQQCTLARKRARSRAAGSPRAETSALSVCLHPNLMSGCQRHPKFTSCWVNLCRIDSDLP
jgi:hypothetical protein